MHGIRGTVALLPGLLIACSGAVSDPSATHKARAERFFRGVYGCVPSVVPELAADDVVVSYPVFQTLFDVSAIRGRDAVEEFATQFCSEWKEAEIEIDETVAEGANVVFLWSFQARNVASGERESWGGITLYRFDDAGKIVAEIGEESEPGPAARVAGSGMTE